MLIAVSKNKCILSFIIIFHTLSFPVIRQFLPCSNMVTITRWKLASSSCIWTVRWYRKCWNVQLSKYQPLTLLCCWWNIRLRASTYCSSRSSNDLLLRSSITTRSDACFCSGNNNNPSVYMHTALTPTRQQCFTDQVNYHKMSAIYAGKLSLLRKKNDNSSGVSVFTQN